MTDSKKHTLPEIPHACGFGDSTKGPDDSLCPVTKYRPEFVPSRLIDEARAGWFPKGIRHCITCELCAPGFSICADSLKVAGGIREGYIPRAFGGALDALVSLQLKDGIRQDRLRWVTDDLHIASENEPSEIALFAGCSPFYDVLLDDKIGFRATDEIKAAVRLLNVTGIKPVILDNEVCCGGDRLHAGDVESFQSLASRNRDLLKNRGIKTVVTTCDDCRFTLGTRYPDYIDEWDFDVVRLIDFISDRKDNFSFNPVDESVAVQNPDSYTDPGNLNSVTRILETIPGLTVRIVGKGHPSTFGGWGQFDAVTKRLETDFIKTAESTGAPTVLIPGTRVLIRLLEGRRPGSWEETSIQIRGMYGFIQDCCEKK